MTGKQFTIVVVCAVFGMTACRTGKPIPEDNNATADIRFVKQINRYDWKERIDEGEVGFHDPANQTLIGLDTPPQINDYGVIVPNVEQSAACAEYLRNHGSQVAKIEFVVSKKGSPSRFYPLKSAGSCDKDVAEAIKQAKIRPAKQNNKPKAALVHLRVELDRPE